MIILGIASLCPYSNNVDNLFIDIFSHFPLQYAIMATSLLFYCLVRKRILFSIMAFFIILLNITVVDIQGLRGFDGYAEAGQWHNNGLTVYSANIHKDNDDMVPLIRDIQRIDPDIIFLMEVSHKQLGQLSEIVEDYEYKVIDPRIEDSGIGVIFLSKLPVIQKRLTPLSKSGNALIEGIITTDIGRVSFYGVHFPRQGLNRNFRMRQREILAFASLISKDQNPFIIAGDFNATPYSPVFREFLRISRLTDSPSISGDLQLSWPTFFPPLWIPIDHILISPDWRIVKKMRGSYIGSDHYPIIAELSLKR